MYRLFFSNGLELDDTDDNIYSIEIVSKMDYSKLNFGSVSSVSISLKLNNNDKRFDNVIFKNKTITCYINDVKKYKFYIDEVTKKNGFINITAYDKIADLDKRFKGIIFPCTLQELIIETLKQVGLTLKTFMFTNQGFVIHNAALADLTCREVLSYCMELCGGIGLLDEEENFNIRWFDTNNPIPIDVNTFISYSSSEEDVILNNIRYSRGNSTYNSNPIQTDIKGTIYLTSDNPLLQHSTSGKISSLISNLNRKQITYFPCQINVLSSEKFLLGDCLSFEDEYGNKKVILVSNITIKNLSNIQIESLGIDTTVSEGEEEGEEEEIINSSSSNNSISIKNIINKEDVQFSECNQNTIIYCSCTITFDDVEPDTNLYFYLDNNIIRTYKPITGTNTFSFTLSNLEKNETILYLLTSNQYSYIEYNFIYSNCLLLDYTEEDRELDTGEVEIAKPGYLHSIMDFTVNVGIEGWRFKTGEDNIGKYEELYYGGLKDKDTDLDYSPMLYSPIRIQNYKELKEREFYIGVNITGEIYSGYNADWGFKYNNAIPDGEDFIYSIKRDEVETFYKTNTGMVKVKNGDIINIFLLKSYFGGMPLGTETDKLEISVSVLDEDIETFTGTAAYKQTINYTYGEETIEVYCPYYGTKHSDIYAIPDYFNLNTSLLKSKNGKSGVIIICEPYAKEGYKEYQEE